MITQIEIDGFKTFKDFKVELAPFQVIVGPNGSGKSNLFDALHLLSRLAEKDIYTAFQELRGDAGELFTKYPDGKTSERIWMAVEMLVDRKGKDGLGKEVELQYRRLRYELEIVQTTPDDGLSQLDIAQEALRIIPIEKDTWVKKHNVNLLNSQALNEFDDKHTLFSVTLDDTHTHTISAFSEFSHFSIRDEEDIINEEGPAYVSTAVQLDGTALSSNSISSFLPSREVTAYHTIAVRETFRFFKFLHLNPEALRQPGSINAPRHLAPDGSNLPTILARMQAEDEFALTDVSRAVASMVQDISHIKVQRDEATNKYTIWANTTDHRTFPAEVLSDGTLRLLALAALSYDSHFRGTLCLEEPENGVQPLQLEKLALLLRGMATNFSELEQVNEPLRQVLITTHSSLFISQPQIIDSLLLAITTSRIQGKGQPVLHVTRMEPVVTPNTLSQIESSSDNDIPLMSYTINAVRRYLGNGELEEAHSQLPESDC